jgi:hypothetical protein
MSGIETPQYPISNTTWTTILDFVLPAEAGRKAQALERITAFLGDTMFHSDRLFKLKIALERAVQKRMDYASEPDVRFPIRFRVLVSEDVLALHFYSDQAQVAPPGCGFFLVQTTGDNAWTTQNMPPLEKAQHNIWLYVYGEGGPAR